MKSLTQQKLKFGWYQGMLSKLMSKKVYSPDFPGEVRIETINSCNSACSFCPMSINSEETKTRIVKKMDEALFKKIIDELVSVNFQGTLKFYTENEPLLDRKRLPGFVRYAKERLPGVKNIQIDTNGLLLTEELGIELITAGINFIHVNDYTKTGGGGVNHKKESIKGIYDKLRRRFPDIRMKYLPRLIEEVLDTRAGHAPNNRSELSKPKEASCIYPFYQFCITSNGNVGLCCVDTVFEEPLGNVNDASIATIWQAKDFTQFRQDLLSGQRKKKLCSNCTFRGHSDLSLKLGKELYDYKLLMLPYKLASKGKITLSWVKSQLINNRVNP